MNTCSNVVTKEILIDQSNSPFYHNVTSESILLQDEKCRLPEAVKYTNLLKLDSPAIHHSMVKSLFEL